MLKRMGLSTVLLLSTVFAGQVIAGQNDLGSRWPNAADVSLSPYWHVYVFHRSGVEFVQVNDMNGNVRQVVAAANGNFLILPMGLDASRVATPQEVPASSVAAQCEEPNCGTAAAKATSQASTSLSQPIYSDSEITVSVKATNGGNLQWVNAPSAAANGQNAGSCVPPECVYNQQPVGNH